MDATFAAFGIDAVYTPAGGEPVPVRVIARRPDAIVGFGDTRIHAETATFEVRASEVASPRQGDQLTVGAESFIVQGEPERRDPDRLVWNLVMFLLVPQVKLSKRLDVARAAERWSTQLPALIEQQLRTEVIDAGEQGRAGA